MQECVQAVFGVSLGDKVTLPPLAGTLFPSGHHGVRVLALKPPVR